MSIFVDSSAEFCCGVFCFLWPFVVRVVRNRNFALFFCFHSCACFFFRVCLSFSAEVFRLVKRTRNLQSSRTTRPQFDRIKKSIMARRAFFFLFFCLFCLLPLGGDARARAVDSLSLRVLRRDFFLCFSRWSLVLALPFCGM